MRRTHSTTGAVAACQGSGDEASLPRLATLLLAEPSERRTAVSNRIATFVTTATAAPRLPGTSWLIEALDSALRNATPSICWLAITVIGAEMPGSRDVVRLHRACRLGEGLHVLESILHEKGALASGEWPDVEVISDAVVVDLQHTARDPLPTGIQRVSREVARRWVRDHDVVLIGWTKDYKAYRRLTSRERSHIIEGSPYTDQPVEVAGGAGWAPEPDAADEAIRGLPEHPPDVEALLGDDWSALLARTFESRPSPPGPPPPEGVIVPWRCMHVVPELPAEGGRAVRYQGFVAFSQSTTGVIGHDCVPLTFAETCAAGMAVNFSNYLAAAARADRIATVSQTSAVEYRGWREMLVGTGLKGPEIEAIPLAVEAHEPGPDDLAEAARLLELGSLPIVLAVGSHEPRKNHLALLHAAEIVWRQGVQFSLAFVGGDRWNTGYFDQQISGLQGWGRPVQVIHRLPDGILWACYRIAFCTVFPSLHEGFGLPVAESLASGTPVITSNYGSMRERSAGGGALLCDPRDDSALASSLHRMLTEKGLRDRLAAEASAIPRRTWDDYAEETWAFLVEGASPRS
jgi:glycosyltransferase involved in cell wall biosynthesis